MRQSGHEHCRHTAYDPLPHEPRMTYDRDTGKPLDTPQMGRLRVLYNRIGCQIHERAVERYSAWLALGRPRGRLQRRAEYGVRLYAAILRGPWRQARARWTIEEDAAYKLAWQKKDAMSTWKELDRRHRVTEHLSR